MASDAPISVTTGRCRVCLNNRHLGAIAQDVDHIDIQFGLVGRDLCCCFLLPIPHSSNGPDPNFEERFLCYSSGVTWRSGSTSPFVRSTGCTILWNVV